MLVWREVSWRSSEKGTIVLRLEHYERTWEQDIIIISIGIISLRET